MCAAVPGRKVKGTIQWVDARRALTAEVRLYDSLLRPLTEGEDEPENFIAALHPNSLEILTDAKVEPSLSLTAAGTRYQFLRVGYFVVDPDTTPEHIVFNRIVGLKDSWSKEIAVK